MSQIGAKENKSDSFYYQEGYVSDGSPVRQALPDTHVKMITNIFKSSVVESQKREDNQDTERMDFGSSPKKEAPKIQAGHPKNHSVSFRTPNHTASKSKNYSMSSTAEETAKKNKIQLDLAKIGGKKLHFDSYAKPPLSARSFTESVVNVSSPKQSIVDRFTEVIKANEQKRMRLTESIKEQEMAECSFSPRVISPTTKKDKRALSKFLEDQNNHLKKVDEKKIKIKAEIDKKEKEQEPKYQPALCEGSIKLINAKQDESHNRDGPIYERLYCLNEKRQREAILEDIDADENEHEDSDFIGKITERNNDKSKINKKLFHSIQEDTPRRSLYERALEKQKKNSQIQKELKEKKNKNPEMSGESKRMMALRFVKEFDINIAKYIDEISEKVKEYTKLNEFLISMNFLKESEKCNNPNFTPERMLLYDLWIILRGDEKRGIHRRNLLVFLLAVLGLQYEITKIDRESIIHTPLTIEKDTSNPNLLSSKLETSSVKEKKKIGSFDDHGNYELKDEEFKKITELFKIWKYNRMSSNDTIGKIISSRYQVSFSHHPEISETTKSIANVRNEKIAKDLMETEPGMESSRSKGSAHQVDRLYHYHNISQIRKHELKIHLTEKKYEECTFKPQILNYVPEEYVEDDGDKKPSTYRSLGVERTNQLYNLATVYKDKRDKTTLDYEYEKGADECTFQPNLAYNMPEHFKKNPYYSVGVEETINRVKTAREEKERVGEMFKRGFTRGNEEGLKFEKNHTYHKQSTIAHVTKKPSNQFGSFANSSMNKSSTNKSVKSSQNTSRKKLVSKPEKEYLAYSNPFDKKKNSNVASSTKELIQSDLQNGLESEQDINLDDKHENGSTQREPEAIPLLYIDVNLGNKNERITIYGGDDPEIIARRFCIEHELDSSMEGKLKAMLEAQITNLLVQIEEENKIPNINDRIEEKPDEHEVTDENENSMEFAPEAEGTEDK